MHKSLFRVAMLAALPLMMMAGCDGIDLSPVAGVIDSTFADPSAPSVAGTYIVVFNDNATQSSVADLVSRFIDVGLSSNREGSRFLNVLNGFVGTLSGSDLALLRADPRVIYIEPDYQVQLSVPGMQYTTTTRQSIPWGISRIGGSRDGTGKRAWIVDTGIDLYNSDLNVDRWLSRNFVGDGHPDAMDGNGHGTHVAGIIGARDNTIGVVGVAPNATLVALRVLDDRGAGTYSSIIAGLDYAAAHGAPGDVINMSLGGPASRALDDAVRRAAARGLKVAIAAGNSATDASWSSPARLNVSGVYTVSAIDRQDRLASFSNYGRPPVDVAAPGVDVLSTRVGGGVLYMSGTSMAAPHVAGLLLFGPLYGSGYARNDPDGSADPIAHW